MLAESVGKITLYGSIVNIVYYASSKPYSRNQGLLNLSNSRVASRGSQRLLNPLIQEYAINYDRNPSKIEGIFLNEGVLEFLGTSGSVYVQKNPYTPEH